MITQRQRGIALVAVLWALVLLAVIAASVTRDSRTQARIARNAIDAAAAEALADAGLHRAIEALGRRGGDRMRVDGTIYSWRFGGGEVRIAVEDEGGKIDLNHADEALIAALLAAAGAGPGRATELAAAIADFRDADDLVRPGGAEDEDYRRAGRAAGPKDAPFAAVEELLDVLGMTPELYGRIAPAVTVHSRRRLPMRELAPPLVGAALAGLEVGRGAAGRPASRAAENGGDGPAGEDEAAAVPFDPTLRVLAEGPSARRSRALVYTVHAEARMEGGAVFARRAVVRLLARGESPYRVLVWGQGPRGLFPAEAN